MITLAMGTEVGAPRDVVWEALTHPEQLRRWRPGVEGEIGGGQGELLAAHTTFRWRCRLHDLPVVLVERPLSATPPERLHSALSLGLFRFEETFSLGLAGPGGGRTLLRLKIASDSEMPLLGGSLDRFAVRRFSTELAATTLQAVRDWCERGAAGELRLPEPPRAVPA